MAGSNFVDVAKFTAVSAGTGSFVVSAAVQGYQTPATAGATGGSQYSYRAENSDLTQWEVGQGTYTSSNVTITRTPIFNSAGGSSAINFTLAPTVGLVALSEDMFTAASKTQQQTGTSNVNAVTPLHQQDHDSAAKAWVTFVASSATILASYNVASVSRVTAGQYTINFATSFASSLYCGVATAVGAATNPFIEFNGSVISASQIGVFSVISASAGTIADPAQVMAVFFGRQ